MTHYTLKPFPFRLTSSLCRKKIFLNMRDIRQLSGKNELLSTPSAGNWIWFISLCLFISPCVYSLLHHTQLFLYRPLFRIKELHELLIKKEKAKVGTVQFPGCHHNVCVTLRSHTDTHHSLNVLSSFHSDSTNYSLTPEPNIQPKRLEDEDSFEEPSFSECCGGSAAVQQSSAAAERNCLKACSVCCWHPEGKLRK